MFYEFIIYEFDVHISRNIKILPLGQGLPCKDVREYQPCNITRQGPGNEYRYAEGQWSPCTDSSKLDPSPFSEVVGCRVSFMWRSVFCYHHDNTRGRAHQGTRTPVPQHLCRNRMKPETKSVCSVR